MIATCIHCGTMFETTEEGAHSPGTMCPRCHEDRRDEDIERRVGWLREAAAEYERLKCR